MAADDHWILAPVASGVQLSGWDHLREWLTAIGTAGAVLVALGIAWWSDRKARRRRPVLSLAFDRDTGIVNETVTYTRRQVLHGVEGIPTEANAVVGRGAAAHLRLEVSNARGHEAAEDVEVLLARIDRPRFTGESETVEISFPPFGWTHLEAIRLTIPPGVTRSVDIGRVHGTPPANEPGPGLDDLVELLVRPEPGNYRNRLPPGTYELRLTVAARNADAADYVMRISFSEENANPHDPAARLNVIDPPYVERRDRSRLFSRARDGVTWWWKATHAAIAVAAHRRD